MILAVTAGNIGMGFVFLVFAGILAAMAVGCLKGGTEILKEGGGFGVIGGLIFIILGLAAGAMAVGSFAGVGKVLSHVDKTQHYPERVITIRSQDATIAEICTQWRPTWSVKDCTARIHEHNRAVDLQHLQLGDKLYLDINIGHTNGGNDERTEIGYKKSVATLSRRFPSLKTVCDRFRPTWKHPYCEQRIRDYNNLPKLGKLKLGTKVELPVTI